MSTFVTACAQVSDKPLPDYVVADLASHHIPAVLRTPAQRLSFPLNAKDKQDIAILEEKFDSEEGCAGLAATQIGISKQIIVFAAPDDPDFKKWRPDLTQTMGKTLWLNPSYKPLGTETHEDYEGCYSVPGVAGLVKRYKKINYEAYTIQGEQVRGVAEGFLARVIQHEIGHLNGELFTDLVPEDKLLSREEYIQMRKNALASDTTAPPS